jgi:hypothetical protein
MMSDERMSTVTRLTDYAAHGHTIHELALSVARGQSDRRQRDRGSDLGGAGARDATATGAWNLTPAERAEVDASRA